MSYRAPRSARRVTRLALLGALTGWSSGRRLLLPCREGGRGGSVRRLHVLPINGLSSHVANGHCRGAAAALAHSGYLSVAVPWAGDRAGPRRQLLRPAGTRDRVRMPGGAMGAGEPMRPAMPPSCGREHGVVMGAAGRSSCRRSRRAPVAASRAGPRTVQSTLAAAAPLPSVHRCG